MLLPHASGSCVDWITRCLVAYSAIVNTFVFVSTWRRR
jgi:hypothetical protein